MELEEDYSEYDDYMELERNWSSNANNYEHDSGIHTEKDPLQGFKVSFIVKLTNY